MGKRRSNTRTKRGTFCTTCGDVLEEYCFSHEAEDIKKVVMNLAICKAEGMFNGKFCAKLFIAGTDCSYRESRKGNPSKRRMDKLKTAILEGIEREESLKRAGR